MKTLPKISIITVVYNAVTLLEQTILSVLEQDYSSVEYIIIDGGSSDGTIALIQKYASYPVVWISEKDSGIYDAMNKGLKLVTGEWIVFLNAGDFLASSHILSLVASTITKNTRLDLVYGGILLDAKEGLYVHPKEFTTLNLLFWGTGTLCHQAMFIKKEKITPYSLAYRYKAELDSYFDLVSRIQEYKRIDEPFVVYLTGGAGAQNFVRNHLEALHVAFKRKGILSIMALPFIVYGFFISLGHYWKGKYGNYY
ncbi:glycosyltransferase family 2 protein [Sulfurospirillum sp. hDNRA2]|jgi:glycosyltransferase involved in cell wall biosynthesis|uniref:glycosyltransferase family 2 protein n=1 Tax=Sulfurospirillum sp. hDNRA2 TaxID=3237298 RepID=UPI000A3E2F52|nr:glycosyltransferase family 2 protein [Sulfurospirillum sp. DNRA8]MCP3653168.1 glycosyltransferase [Sulfurospirillum sp. DNRA8]MCR1812019.1 glycosyltransferase [Sulfurospirillum sp. DNRA8]